MVQGDVGVAARHARQQWSQQSGERNQRIPAECTKEKIEPDHIRFEFSNGFKQSNRARWVVE
jgi:hypothetical protein